MHVRSHYIDRQSHLVIYDPIEQRTLFKMPHRRTLALPDSPYLLIEHVDGTFELIHARTGASHLKLDYKPSTTNKAISNPQVWEDSLHYYIQYLQPASFNPYTGGQYTSFPNARGPIRKVKGTLLAFDKTTGKLNWKRQEKTGAYIQALPKSFPLWIKLSSSFTRTPKPGSPRLTTVKRALKMSLVDPKTGQTIKTVENLKPDSQYIYHTVLKDNSGIRLHNTVSEIEVRLTPQGAQKDNYHSF